jgi:hypothetical protein
LPTTDHRLASLDARQRRLAITLAVVVAAPFFIAALQARAGGWYPVGDDGTMVTVARQVFSAHPPLTGEVASFDRFGIHAFHPGPLVYYLLAPFVAVFGPSTGLLLGAATISAAAMLLIGYVALRTAGPWAAVGAWATAWLMVWSLGGTAFVYRPFKTVSAVLVILLFLHLSAALVAGRPGLLPLWVLAGSYPMAASVRYAVPIAGVALATVVAVVLRRWWTSRDGATGRRDRLRRTLALDRHGVRSVVLAALVAVAAWWAPAYDALAHDGGNLRQLYRGVRAASGSTDGLAVAAGELARAALFDPVTTVADHLAASWAYTATLALVAVVVLAALAARRRSAGPLPWAYVVVSGAATVATLVLLATTPTDEGFGLHRLLGASPAGAFLVFTLGLAVAAAAGERVRLPRPAAIVALAALVVVVVAGAVPGPLREESEDYPWAFDATRTLVEQAAPHLAGDGQWSFALVGGRSTPTVFVGLKAGLEVEGVDTGLDAGAPGLGDTTDAAPPAGAVVVMPSFLPGPEGWEAVARYEPDGRDVEAADAAADALVAFAEATDPEPLPTLAYGLTAFLCPGLAATPSGYDVAACPPAQEALAADEPLAEVDPGIVALVYLTEFGEFTQVPVIDGARPPQDLLDAAAATWDDIPLTVYAQRVEA